MTYAPPGDRAVADDARGPTRRPPARPPGGTGAGGRVVAVALPLATLLLLIALWELATIAFDVDAFIVPSPTDIARALEESRATLPGHAWATLWETLLGFALSVAVGVPLAVLIVYSRFLERTIYPILLALQAVPKVAIAPVLVLWMGFGIGPKIVVIFLIAVFPIVISTATGLRSTPPEFLDLARSLSASQWQTFRRIRFPGALAQIFVGLKVAISLAVIGAVIGEFVGADEGLGYVIVISGGNVNTALAFAAMVLLSLISIVLFYALVALERLLVPWADQERQ